MARIWAALTARDRASHDRHLAGPNEAAGHHEINMAEDLTQTPSAAEPGIIVVRGGNKSYVTFPSG